MGHDVYREAIIIMKYIKQTLLIVLLVLPSIGMSAGLNMDTARVFYRQDGGVSIMYFNKEACQQNEEPVLCMDRLMVTTNEYGLPYDDMSIDEIVKLDRSQRDKWRGEKGKGIHVDTTLVSKRDKVVAYQEELNTELDKAEPNASRILKLQRLIEQVNDLPNPILSKDEIKQFDMKRKGIVARAVSAVTDAVSGVVDSLRASVAELAQVFTGRLQVGTPTAPTGITVYDIDTGEPSCIVVRSGRLESTRGECSDVSGNVESNSAIIKDPLEQPPPLNGGEPTDDSSAEVPVELGNDGLQDLLEQQPVVVEPQQDVVVDTVPTTESSSDIPAQADSGESLPVTEEPSP